MKSGRELKGGGGREEGVLAEGGKGVKRPGAPPPHERRRQLNQRKWGPSTLQKQPRATSRYFGTIRSGSFATRGIHVLASRFGLPPNKRVSRAPCVTGVRKEIQLFFSAPLIKEHNF